MDPTDLVLSRACESPLVRKFAGSGASQHAFTVKRTIRRVLFRQRSQLCRIVLLAAVFASPASCKVDAATMLEVKGTKAFLYRQPQQQSEVVAELKPGEELMPLGNVIMSGESWYMVETKDDVLGWIRSSDVRGIEQVEKTFKKEYESVPPSETQSERGRTPEWRPPPKACVEACGRAVIEVVKTIPELEGQEPFLVTVQLCTKSIQQELPKNKETVCAILGTANVTRECMTYYECSTQ